MSVRILHTGDEHLDATTYGETNRATGLNTTTESNRDALASLVTAAIDNHVDVFLSAGDMFNGGRPTQETVLMAADTLRPLADAGIPIVLLGGNTERLHVPSVHRTATTTLGAMLARHGEVHTIEHDSTLIRTHNGIQLACLPWLAQGPVLEHLNITHTDPTLAARAVTQYATDALHAMCEQADVGAPLIVAAHLSVHDDTDRERDAAARGSETDMAVLFNEPSLPRQALIDTPATYVALSHVHTRQVLDEKCHYAGAPNRFTFADADQPKSANLVTLTDAGELASIEHVPATARPMHRIHLDHDVERLHHLQPGAIIELTLPAGMSEPPAAIRRIVANAHARIATVKATPIEPVRTPGVALPETVTPVDALRTWAATKHPDYDQARLLATATALLEETQA